ncbi:MAG: hypothetical protein QOG53_426 [Frankiales bacterium]|nr:hypothetical protein [Frankiales bacterium]
MRHHLGVGEGRTEGPNALRALDDKMLGRVNTFLGAHLRWQIALVLTLAAIPVLAVGLITGNWKVAGAASVAVAVQLSAMGLVRVVRRSPESTRWPRALRGIWLAFGSIAIPWIILRLSWEGPRTLRVVLGIGTAALLYIGATSTIAARWLNHSGHEGEW